MEIFMYIMLAAIFRKYIFQSLISLPTSPPTLNDTPNQDNLLVKFSFNLFVDLQRSFGVKPRKYASKMKNSVTLLVFTFFNFVICYQYLFERINKETVIFNAIGAEIGWQSLINPENPTLPEKAAKFQDKRLRWQHSLCEELSALYLDGKLNSTEVREVYLLCRGPKYTFEEIRQISNLYEEIQTIYHDAEVCFPAHGNKNLSDYETAILNLPNELFSNPNFLTNSRNAICLKGERDFDKIARYSKKESVLKWIWLAWREKMKAMKTPYLLMMNIENIAAKRNGYKDIGALWRDETELNNVRRLCYQLYERILPIYKLLHGVARYHLRKLYGNVIPERGPIPAHLLGDLWSQSWGSLADVILPRHIDFDFRIEKLNWTVNHMVKRAEDFYTSLGLPAMTDQFWRQSVFERENSSIRCHGTAADMFKDGDYRLLYCSETTFEDLYVLHHEMGHIQYYMAYKKQPGLFRQANTALHETIGDTIMLGVYTPQHLHRLGLINDDELYTDELIHERKDPFEENDKPIEDKTPEVIRNPKIHNNKAKLNNLDEFISVNNYENLSNKEESPISLESIKTRIENKREFARNRERTNDFANDITVDDVLILKQALIKLPQIPFSLVLDEYRWKLFEGRIDNDKLNEEFWKLTRDLQGIEPPGQRGEEYFDIGAKYHVADNIPYTRYFLSSFLQYQLFEKLCIASVFGRRNVKSLPESMPLHRCDIYGSKMAGKILRETMSSGNSQHWMQTLQKSAGIDKISSDSLEKYYQVLYKMLTKFVVKYNIPIGW